MSEFKARSYLKPGDTSEYRRANLSGDAERVSYSGLKSKFPLTRVFLNRSPLSELDFRSSSAVYTVSHQALPQPSLSFINTIRLAWKKPSPLHSRATSCTKLRELLNTEDLLLYYSIQQLIAIAWAAAPRLTGRRLHALLPLFPQPPPSNSSYPHPLLPMQIPPLLLRQRISLIPSSNRLHLLLTKLEKNALPEGPQIDLRKDSYAVQRALLPQR